MSAEIASYPPKPGHLIWYDVHTRYRLEPVMGRHTDYTADWPVPARWPADCPECHQPWQPGDAIVRDGGRWVHHQCPDREDT